MELGRHDLRGHGVWPLQVRCPAVAIDLLHRSDVVMTLVIDPRLCCPFPVRVYSDVLSIDALYKERAVSCGRDRTVRMWKVRIDSMLSAVVADDHDASESLLAH